MGNSNTPSRTAEADLRALEHQVDALIRTCLDLKSENQALRGENGHLATERRRLLERTEQARTRLETLIARLRTMERDS